MDPGITPSSPMARAGKEELWEMGENGVLWSMRKVATGQGSQVLSASLEFVEYSKAGHKMGLESVAFSSDGPKKLLDQNLVEKILSQEGELVVNALGPIVPPGSTGMMAPHMEPGGHAAARRSHETAGTVQIALDSAVMDPALDNSLASRRRETSPALPCLGGMPASLQINTRIPSHPSEGTSPAVLLGQPLKFASLNSSPDSRDEILRLTISPLPSKTMIPPARTTASPTPKSPSLSGVGFPVRQLAPLTASSAPFEKRLARSVAPASPAWEDDGDGEWDCLSIASSHPMDRQRPPELRLPEDGGLKSRGISEGSESSGLDWQESSRRRGEAYGPMVSPLNGRGNTCRHTERSLRSPPGSANLSASTTPSNAAGEDVKGKELKPGDRIYPFTLARYVPMMDVIDDGPVPDQRAGGQSIHADLTVVVKTVSDLPKTDANGMCDCYCEVQYKEYDLHNLKPKMVTHKTAVVKGQFDPEFNESFSIFVHHLQVQASIKKSGASSVVINLYDWDRFKSNEFIGHAALDLRDLLRLPDEGGEIASLVTDAKGNRVIGHSGKLTTVRVFFKLSQHVVNAQNRSHYKEGAAFGSFKQRSRPSLLSLFSSSSRDLAGSQEQSQESGRRGRRKSSIEMLFAILPGGEASPEGVGYAELDGREGRSRERRGSLIDRERVDPSKRRVLIDTDEAAAPVGGAEKSRGEVPLAWRALAHPDIAAFRKHSESSKMLDVKGEEEEEEEGGGVRPELTRGNSMRLMHSEKSGFAALLQETEEGKYGVDDDEFDQEIQDLENSEWYWREWLEHMMESGMVNLFIIMLVLLNLTIIIVLVAPDSTSGQSSDDLVSTALMIDVVCCFVVCCFVVEILLRIITQRHRFWRNLWNLFDFAVVMAAFAIVVAQLAVEKSSQSGLGTGKTSDSTLRAISRVAMGLCVLRVLVNLRKAQSVGGALSKSLRRQVSQNKRRYIKHQFDLDLTYITNRVMAMSAPAFGGHTAYRNDINLVSRFLSTRHYGCFFVFNLCDNYYSSDGVMGNYHPQMLFNQVARIPFEDHSPPTLVEMIEFCQDATRWLLLHPKHVISVHCKGGKGRTGLMISALLLWTGHRKCAIDALELFTFRRTEDYDPDDGLDDAQAASSDAGEAMLLSLRRIRHNQGVGGPSQIRYVHYLETIIYNGVDPFCLNKTHLMSVNLPVCSVTELSPKYVSFAVRCCRTLVLDSRTRDKAAMRIGGRRGDTIVLPGKVVVWGDVRIDFYFHKNEHSLQKRTLGFFVVFHTAFYKGENQIVIKKRFVDMLHKDGKNKVFDSDFSLTMRLDSSSHSLEHLRVAAEFRDIVRKYGTKKTFSMGEVIVSEGNRRGELFLVTNGTVEGFVQSDEGSEEGASLHPLCACVPSSLEHDSISTPRVPLISIVGVDSVVGESPFLSRCSGMPVRARSATVEVYAVQVELPEASINREIVDASQRDMIAPAGMSTEEVATFYRGLAITLATQLSRALMENLRISGLKALNDKRSALNDLDDREQVRLDVIEKLGLPLSETVAVMSKCFFREGGDSVPEVYSESKLRRLIIMQKHLVVDSEVYGPAISVKKSKLIRVDQLKSVSFKDRYLTNTLILEYHPTGDEPEDEALSGSCHVNIAELTFQSVPRANQVYRSLLSRCAKAQEDRERMRSRPYETATIKDLVAKCGTVHSLRNKEQLHEAQSTDSLFMIRRGNIKLTRRGKVYRFMRRGECFGLADFVQHAVSGYYEAFACGETVVIELPQGLVSSRVHADPELSSKFYVFVCQVMEYDLREALRETFPGSWCHELEKMASLDVEGQEMTANRTPVRQRTGWKGTRNFRNSGKVASSKDGGSKRENVNDGGSSGKVG